MDKRKSGVRLVPVATCALHFSHRFNSLIFSAIDRPAVGRLVLLDAPFSKAIEVLFLPTCIVVRMERTSRLEGLRTSCRSNDSIPS